MHWPTRNNWNTDENTIQSIKKYLVLSGLWLVWCTLTLPNRVNDRIKMWPVKQKRALLELLDNIVMIDWLDGVLRRFQQYCSHITAASALIYQLFNVVISSCGFVIDVDYLDWRKKIFFFFFFLMGKKKKKKNKKSSKNFVEAVWFMSYRIR